MTHPNFKRCEKCGEEIHIIDGKEVPYDIYLKKKRIDEIRGQLG